MEKEASHIVALEGLHKRMREYFMTMLKRDAMLRMQSIHSMIPI